VYKVSSGMAGHVRLLVGRPLDPLLRAATCMAGPIVESRHTGVALDELHENGSTTDFLMARRALQSIGRWDGANLDRMIEVLNDWAAFDEPLLDRIAGALATRRRLDYLDCVELIGGATDGLGSIAVQTRPNLASTL
jgi:hypothetical protein